MVLRVSRIRALLPDTASVHSRVRVATPDRWVSRLSAVRSAVSRSRTGPVAVSSTSPGRTMSPSAAVIRTLTRPCPTTAKTKATTGRPATTPASRGTTSA